MNSQQRIFEIFEITQLKEYLSFWLVDQSKNHLIFSWLSDIFFLSERPISIHSCLLDTLFLRFLAQLKLIEFVHLALLNLIYLYSTQWHPLFL
jgi:hypothetical protein